MDSQVSEIISREAERQSNTIELIASENHVSSAVTEAVGSCLTNKYAEGYPGKRYYFGCDNYDEIEVLAQERAKKLFNCNFANVQPHSGASANIAAFLAFMKPGDVYASLVLSDGGHLSHGLKINISGKYFFTSSLVARCMSSSTKENLEILVFWFRIARSLFFFKGTKAFDFSDDII